jgi:hypothetical protein
MVNVGSSDDSCKLFDDAQIGQNMLRDKEVGYN